MILNEEFMKARIALGLVILSLFLLLVYGADESAKQGDEEGGFLHLDAMVRGIGFGGTAVALSTVAFFISIKERTTLVSILLLFNGVLIIIGGVMATMASISTGSSGTGGYGVLGMGIWILVLGIIKGLKT